MIKQDISRFKTMSDKHGGARQGAGRKPKADEMKLIEGSRYKVISIGGRENPLETEYF